MEHFLKSLSCKPERVRDIVENVSARPHTRSKSLLSTAVHRICNGRTVDISSIAERIASTCVFLGPLRSVLRDESCCDDGYPSGSFRRTSRWRNASSVPLPDWGAGRLRCRRENCRLVSVRCAVPRLLLTPRLGRTDGSGSPSETSWFDSLSVEDC